MVLSKIFHIALLVLTSLVRTSIADLSTQDSADQWKITVASISAPRTPLQGSTNQEYVFERDLLDNEDQDHEGETEPHNETDNSTLHSDEHQDAEEHHEDEDHDHEHAATDQAILTQGSESTTSFIVGDASNDKPWGAAILAAFLVNLCTLIGVLFAIVPAAVLRNNKASSDAMTKFLFHIALPSFACGALLATAVFLLIPESLHLLSGGHDDHHDDDPHDDEHTRKLEGELTEAEIGWAFGVSIMGGYFLPFMLSGLFPNTHIPANETSDVDTPTSLEYDAEENMSDSEMEYGDDGETIHQALPQQGKSNHHDGSEDDATNSKDMMKKQAPPETPRAAAVNYNLAISILAGDFFHNFADGVFIGTSFLLCTRSVAVTVAAATVFHELSQELADYFLLTNQCGLPKWKALGLNFLSGFSVLLGVIVIFATDVSNGVIGSILGVSAGVYFYIALTECAPQINAHLPSLSLRLWSFLYWLLGAIPIALVLLNHQHCD